MTRIEKTALFTLLAMVSFIVVGAVIYEIAALGIARGAASATPVHPRWDGCNSPFRHWLRPGSVGQAFGRPWLRSLNRGCQRDSSSGAFPKRATGR